MRKGLKTLQTPVEKLKPSGKVPGLGQATLAAGSTKRLNEQVKHNVARFRGEFAVAFGHRDCEVYPVSNCYRFSAPGSPLPPGPLRS
jgi:hypothetical protein